MTPKLIAAIVAPLALFAIPAAAVDGEILVDQAAVKAGGVTPGDDAGFPATLSKPGRYKLTSNLTVPAGATGILVTTENVTIDLNGFTIASSQAGQGGSGVFGSPPFANGLRVMNGTIVGFGDFGVANRQNDSSRSAVIENMRILSNGVGIFVGRDARIRDSTIANSPRGNIACLQSCLIEGNLITGSTNGAGIALTGGTVLGNLIVSNKFNGLAADVNGTGYGNNILFGNNGGGAQVGGAAFQLHPNVCVPGCP
jgi:hypothetical protein